MIIEEKVKDLVVVGEDTSKKAKISGDKLAKLQYLLTKGLYRDPITAVIAEWTNNGIDAVVQAGKNPIENPVLVTIQQDSKGQHIFRVEDKGTGLDDRDFEDICMNYLESTKESDNDTIGHFGIGMKSFLSLERSATFTCRKNGIERKYLVYEGAEFVNFDLIYQKDTTEENGVTAELQINNWSERSLFIDKASAKLAYYDTAVLIVDGVVKTNDIYRNELFQYSTMNRNNVMHLCLKDVYYAIDWEALGIRHIEVPVAIRLNLGDGLTPTPSRESYITNEKVKELLLTKIKEISEWFVTKYNDKVKLFKTFMDAFEFLGETMFFVKIADKTDIKINPMIPYSSIKVVPVKVDGINVRNPNDYKLRKHHLFYGWTPVAYLNHSGVMKTKRGVVSREHHILNCKHKVVKVKDVFTGNVRDFLREKYMTNTLFVRDTGVKRRLGKAKEYTPTGQIKIDVETYRHILDLNLKPKTEWRKLIDEWDFVVSSITNTFVDETKVEDTKEYQVWLDAKRLQQKLKRKAGAVGYSGLGKTAGDVTLAYAYNRHRKVHFGKKAYPINELHKNKFLTVLVTEDDDLDLVKEIISALKGNHIKWALVGKKEIRKIPKHFQFINLQTFMSRDCKPFQRLASALLFDKTLEELEQVHNYKSGIFQNVLKALAKDKKTLEDYVELHIQDGVSKKISALILDAAEVNKLFDLSIMDVHNRVKENIKKYDFVNLLKEPNSYDTASQKRYEVLIAQLLLFRKKYYDDLPEGTKIVFEEPEETKTETDEVV